MEEIPTTRPLVAELVGEPTSASRERVLAAMVTLTPIVARLCWWWWTQARDRHPADPLAQASNGAPAAIEHTDIKMVKRPFGRWKITVASTRWQLPEGPAPASARSAGGRTLVGRLAHALATTADHPAPVAIAPRTTARPQLRLGDGTGSNDRRLS